MTFTLVSTLVLVVLTALMVREAWLGYPPAGFAARALTRKEQAILRASAEAFFPAGGSLPSADQAGVVLYVDRMLAGLPTRQRVLLRVLFVLVEHGSLIFGPNRSRLTRQSIDERIETFRRWESSDFYFRRLSFLSLRTLMTLAYFGDPCVRRAVAPVGRA